MAGLLAGTRVLDLTNVLAGPFCCYQLALLGAEVIKVEVPGSGDLARQLGADPELNRRGMGASFLAQNAGKRSITLNLKSSEGSRCLQPAGRHLRRRGRELPPRRDGRASGSAMPRSRRSSTDIIYCAISGFGQDGPLQVQPGL